MSLVAVAPFAVVFTWFGLVLGISFLETPLRFTSPGITVGIGRRVFRVLNIVESVLAVLLIVIAAIGRRGGDAVAIGALVALCVVLLGQAAVLRPLMDRGVTSEGVAADRPSSSLHRPYVVLECVKLVLLLALGVALAV